MQVEVSDSKVVAAGAHHHRPFERVAVLGAGTMGAQIAAHAANAGLEVLLLDLAATDDDDRNAVVASMFKKAQKLRPDPFFEDSTARRIRLGNFDDDFAKLANVDWVVEAVVERMDIKRNLMERIEQVVGPDTIVSTNTSGLPIGEIAAGRSEAFRQRFLGTHFFNPPRYLRLLELVPTPDTAPDVLDRVSWFGRVHLGKGIVVAKDRPYFIGNRIGIYAMLSAIRWFEDGRLSIEDIDALTGPLTGRPKSATFRTADVVGLDVMQHVIENLHAAIASDDESADAFTTPKVLASLVKNGALGAKTGAGYYQKVGKEIRSIDPTSREYTSGTPSLELGEVWSAGRLPDRIRALYASDGVAGDFFRSTTLDLLGYSARRIPEISDNPADVDRAVKWGFGWEMGPFEIWDALGVERVIDDMRERQIVLPDWVTGMDSPEGFYGKRGAARTVYVPQEQAKVVDPVPQDEVSLAVVKVDPTRTLWENEAAGLLDLGDGVALFEFRSKANALGQSVMNGFWDAMEHVESDANLCGLVVANEGKNFSVGANLVEVAAVVQAGRFDDIEKFLRRFQDVVQRVRYASKPVVAAVHQMALGGGCEVAMASEHPVVAAEAYVGLVELGVGVIPAGTGTTRLAVRAAEGAPNGFVSEIQSALNRAFQSVASAKVSRSGREAVSMGYLPAATTVVMNGNRRIHAARARVLQLAASGYLPPAKRSFVAVGRPGGATLEAAAYNFLQGRYISEYDYYLAKRLAYVLTGGSLTGAQEVDEDYMLGLEREVFLSLLGEKKTQERIEHMLKTGKPLRN